MIKNQKIQITEILNSGIRLSYKCNGLVDALCRFGSCVSDDDHEEFTESGYDLQEDSTLTKEKLQDFLNRFSENIVNVNFVN